MKMWFCWRWAANLQHFLHNAKNIQPLVDRMMMMMMSFALLLILFCAAQTDSWWHICPVEPLCQAGWHSVTETLPNRWACNCVWFNDRESFRRFIITFIYLFLHRLTWILRAFGCFFYEYFNGVAQWERLFQVLKSKV